MPDEKTRSRLIGEFHETCIDHPHLFSESVGHVERRLPELHALFGKNPTPFSLTPFLFTAHFFKNISSVCSDLAEILETVGHRALSDDGLLRNYAFPDHFKEILRVDPGYPRLAPVLRLDGHFDKGVFRLVETNADGSAGMNDSNALERAVRETPVYRELEKRLRIKSCEMVDPLARLLVKYLDRATPDPRYGLIDILDLPGVSTASEFVAVRNAIQKMGRQAVIVTPADLRYRRCLTAAGRPLHLIYRRLVTSDALEHWAALAPLLKSYRAGKIRMVGSFRSELLHNKAVLTLLHDPRIRKKLSPAARALIDRHVPKAFVLTKETAEAARTSKNRWVIKPLDSYGSRGVTVGRAVSRAKWIRALKDAYGGGRYLLQEYVRAPVDPVARLVRNRPKISLEMTSVGFFLYDGKMAGPYVRSGPVHPLSISYGAVTRPGFVCSGLT